MTAKSESFFYYAFANGLRPDPDDTIDQWADAHRLLTTIASSEPGPWQTARTPYLQEIMQCLSPSHPCERVIVMKGAQVGGTECGNNWVGFVIHHSPGPMLIVNPTVEMAKRTSKMRIDPMIDNCAVLKNLVQNPRARDSGNTVLMKEFPGGVLILTGANSAVGLRSMPVRFLFLDEVDGYPAQAGDEGDPVDLAIQRTATFANRKIFLVSTPTIKNYSRIEKGFDEGDKRFYFIPCPKCGHYQILTWSQIRFEQGKPQNAWYECEKCGDHWQDYQKTELLGRGKWIATAPDKSNGKIVSFHLSSLYSPHGWTSWGDIATEFTKVHKDPSRLQVWTNTKLAETWQDQAGESIDPTGLMARRENYGPKLPADVAILTCGVDVQDDRLELEIVGWGKDEESWSIDYHVLHGDPSTPQLWDDLDSVLTRLYEHERDIAPFGIAATCVDSGGHYTDYVINYCAARTRQRVFAIKGSSSGFGVPIFPARASQNKRLKKPVYVLGVNDAKQALMQRLRIKESGPGCCHFPFDRDAEWFSQLTSEVIKTKIVKGRAVREWQPRTEGHPCEGLDCRIYAFAALRGLVRNWKLDLNALTEQLKNYSLRNADIPRNAATQQQSNIVQPQQRRSRVRSKGINL